METARMAEAQAAGVDPSLLADDGGEAWRRALVLGAQNRASSMGRN